MLAFASNLTNFQIERIGFAYQVVPEELHDKSRILVALFAQRIQLCEFLSVKVGANDQNEKNEKKATRASLIIRTSNSIVESELSQVASLVR